MKLHSRLMLGVAAAFAAGVALVVTIGDPPRYQEDGYNYAVVMRMDRGASFSQAVAQASIFYRSLPAASRNLPGASLDPELIRRLGHTPEYWDLFRVRALAPFVASLIEPVAGFAALPDVSRFGFVLTAALTVLLLARFIPVGWALAGALGMIWLPAWRDIGRSALTDALSTALVTAAVLAALWMLDRPSPMRAVVVALLIGAVAWTRPIPYLFVAGGLSLAGWGIAAGQPRAVRVGAALGLIALAWTIVLGVSAVALHAPGLPWIVADAYRHAVAGGHARPGEQLLPWYLHEELRIIGRAVAVSVITVVPVLAAVGLWLGRRRSDLWLLAGCIAGSAFGTLVNPSRFDVIRCVALPIAPMLAACAGYAASRWPGWGHLAQGLQSYSAWRKVSGRPLSAGRSIE